MIEVHIGLCLLSDVPTTGSAAPGRPRDGRLFGGHHHQEGACLGNRGEHLETSRVSGLITSGKLTVIEAMATEIVNLVIKKCDFPVLLKVSPFMECITRFITSQIAGKGP